MILPLHTPVLGLATLLPFLLLSAFTACVRGEQGLAGSPVQRGHDAAHIALFDARTGILFTGDTLYPGRLYVRDFPTYVASIDRLVTFTSTRPVAHILGTQIEQSRTPFTDYKIRTVHQPDETTLELRRGDLLELQ